MGDPRRRLSNEDDFALLNSLLGSDCPGEQPEPVPPSAKIQEFLSHAGTPELRGLFVAIIDELRVRVRR
jgi:hypothetical protein